MKNLLAILVAVLFLAANANAAIESPGNNNTDDGEQTFEIYVVCPIAVTPESGSVPLGNITPGDVVENAFDAYPATFLVTGHYGKSFSYTTNFQAIGTYTGGSSPGNVTINTVLWQEYSGGSWNNTPPTGSLALNGGTNSNTSAGCDATRSMRCIVKKMTAENNAAEGVYTFDVNLTATYNGI